MLTSFCVQTKSTKTLCGLDYLVYCEVYGFTRICRNSFSVTPENTYPRYTEPRRGDVCSGVTENESRQMYVFETFLG